VEEIVHEVAADTKLRESRIWVAHRCELTSLEPMNRLARPLAEIVSTEKPPLRFSSSLFVMAVDA
jgi:hypothetical protein